MPSVPPSLFVLLPVHNRCAVTRRCLEQLRATGAAALRVVVIDDGSTDGTAEMLSSFEGLHIDVVSGDGSLWWGGAIAAGMRFVDRAADDSDMLLLMNDDVEFSAGLLDNLRAAWRELGPDVVIGCLQRDLDYGHAGCFGYRIDYHRQCVRLVSANESPDPVVDLDALLGRGVLLGVRTMRAIGYVDAERFPHYMCDVEYTARARDLGYRVCALRAAEVWTSFAPSDSVRAGAGWKSRFFSPFSSRNLRQQIEFWRRRGPAALRKTALIRYPWLQLWRKLSGSTATSVGP